MKGDADIVFQERVIDGAPMVYVFVDRALTACWTTDEADIKAGELLAARSDALRGAYRAVLKDAT